eukprot:EW704239.1.p7 GENE.EW704239.1~~EW704239.1.p7  ORF type:complete len:50 (-),score=13.18 EW704239.1:18-167(-)
MGGVAVHHRAALLCVCRLMPFGCPGAPAVRCTSAPKHKHKNTQNAEVLS